MAAVIVISLIAFSLIAWYFCKRRRTGDVHFSVLFQISLTESKIRKCLNLFNMSAKEHQSISLRIEFYKNYPCSAKKC